MPGISWSEQAYALGICHVLEGLRCVGVDLILDLMRGGLALSRACASPLGKPNFPMNSDMRLRDPRAYVVSLDRQPATPLR
jgi:hypothetical protein